MPQPPSFDFFTDMKFVTNYFLAGCEPPVHLVIEFSQEPAKDLLLLFLVPDLVDIGQAIFEPKGGRRRKPARHGRKRRRGKGMPDPSDMIGQRIRAVVNPHDVITFGPLVKAFKIWNAYELLQITVAVLDGLSDIGFESLWGILEADPNHCKNLSRLSKYAEDPQHTGSGTMGFASLVVNHLAFNRGFNHTPLLCACRDENYRITMKARISATEGTGRLKGQLALISQDTDKRYYSSGYDLGPGKSEVREVTGKFDAGETCLWGVIAEDGIQLVSNVEILAYGIKGIPFPI